MRKRIFAGLCALLLAVSMTACGASSSTGDSGKKTESTENALADGTYTADFTTDSDMFHANKACKGKGLLTVKDGKMTFHVSLVSEKIVNLFVGTAEDAAKDGAELLQPTTDTVYYDDGTSEEVYGYDIPVAEVGKEFDLAIYGTKGKWYDHKVKVENPVEGDSVPGMTPSADASAEDKGAEADHTNTEALADGDYTISAALTGGSGKASITSPLTLHVKDGKITADVEFSSDKYDYALVNGTKYEPDLSSGKSMFTLPVEAIDKGLSVTADTTAMSEPHEIDYVIEFDDSTLNKAE